MYLIGVTGMIGSGKSTACEYIEKQGGKVIYADKIGHEVLSKPPEPYIFESIRNICPECVSGEIDDPIINKKILSDKMFGNEEKLNTLSELLDPYIYDYITEEIDENSGKEVIFIESARFINLAVNKYFNIDYVLKINTFTDNRMLRTNNRYGMSQNKFNDINKIQKNYIGYIPDWVINNDDSKLVLEHNVNDFLDNLNKNINKENKNINKEENNENSSISWIF